jgi:hypothetical protein
MILRDAVLKANEKYFANATSDVDYMNAVMAYYKEYLFVMKMAMGGFQTELNNITRKYANSTSDTEVIKWAGEIRKLFDKKKVIKNSSFDPIEYLAVNYIAGHHGAANWAELAEQ